MRCTWPGNGFFRVRGGPAGGAAFAQATIIPDTDDPALGSNGTLQGLFMQKFAVNGAADIAVVNSRFDAEMASRVRRIRGRISRVESTN